MALDAGEAMPDACKDYFATSLNRLARLLAADHGTQIQLTSDVRDSAPGDLRWSADHSERTRRRCRFQRDTTPGGAREAVSGAD